MLLNDRHAEFSLLPDPAPITPGDTVFIFREKEVLLHAEYDANRIPFWKDVEGAAAYILPRHAFSQGGRRFFITAAGADMAAPPGFGWEQIRVFRTLLPELDGMLLSAAWHLYNWYANNRFCGVCGGPMQPHPTERALMCKHCGRTVYPTILPAVIVAVINGDKLLLARNAQGAFRRFSLLAGFVEVGETAEQAVAREVLEEAGLRLKNIRYIASQPWGFSQSLMLGFIAELDGSSAIQIQESELAEARWFSREEIPGNDSTASIAFDLMEQFRRGML